MTKQIETEDGYWSQDITVRLMERANTARQEGHATALGDAVHFEEAAKEIARLRTLAAATTDLLAAARAYITQIDAICLPDDDVTSQIRAAIAKATA